ncbi:MAG TPA: hypothetical protein VGQ44_18580 [Gemmatimonadaceae bacterium]|nr:hypothetical protein [Gemmatimonadaceae bacterium]
MIEHRLSQWRLWMVSTLLGLGAAVCAVQPAVAQKQQGSVKKVKADKPDRAPDDTAPLAKFFESEEPLPITLTLNVKRIRGDKDDTAPWRDATITYTPPGASAPEVLPLKLKTHGIWRLNHCDFPPIRLDFSKDNTKKTIFSGLNKPKLTNFCRDDDTYERYVLQELQAYRIYWTVTHDSHAVRALKVTYVDSASGKPLTTRYAFIQEDPGRLSARLGGKILDIKGAGPGDTQAGKMVLMSLFQYLVGNTDWSISGLHNVELFARNDGTDPFPIARDFDFAGLVNARYATVDPRLKVRVVRDRLYRGYCVPNEEYSKAFAVFDAKKDAIYALYHDKVGSLLPADMVSESLKYFDDFYKTIDNPKNAKSDIIEACVGKR